MQLKLRLTNSMSDEGLRSYWNCNEPSVSYVLWYTVKLIPSLANVVTDVAICYHLNRYPMSNPVKTI